MTFIALLHETREVIDDLAAILQGMYAGIAVFATHNPQEASRWIDQRRPTLLVVDIHLPEHAGSGIVSHAFNTWGSVPVIVLSDQSIAMDGLGALRCLEPVVVNSSGLGQVVDAAAFEELVEAMVAHPPEYEGPELLGDLLTLYEARRATGALYVTQAMDQGMLFLSQGQVIHARAELEVGQAALKAILGWTRVDNISMLFSVNVNRPIPEKVVELQRAITGSNLPRISTGNFQRMADSFNDFEVMEAPSTLDQFVTDDTDEELDIDVLLSQPMSILAELSDIVGFIGVTLVHLDSGMVLGHYGAQPVELAAATSYVTALKASQETVRLLNPGECIKDILLTLEEQLHVLRPSEQRPDLFFYLTLDKEVAELDEVRLRLREFERVLS